MTKAGWWTAPATRRTAVTLGISKDPADGVYENFRRFTINSGVDEFEGTVQLINGAPFGIDLTSDVTVEVVGFLGATMTGFYPGAFSISGKQFEFPAHDTQTLDKDGTMPAEELAKVAKKSLEESRP